MWTKKGKYGLKALLHLAALPAGTSALSSEIAAAHALPAKFLEAILLELRNAGFIRSRKGKGGGYYLKLPPNKISLARIIRKIDGPISMLPCVSLYFYERCKNCDEKNCGLHDTMVLVRDANLKLLEKKTVADLAKK